MNKYLFTTLFLVIAGAVVGGIIVGTNNFTDQASKKQVLKSVTPISGGEKCGRGGVCPNGAVASSTKPVALETSKDKDCAQDSDCVEVSIYFKDNECCSGCGSEAITAKAAVRREAWRASNCSQTTWRDCPMFDCTHGGFFRPVCVSNRCELTAIKSIGECNGNIYCLNWLAFQSGDKNVCDEVKKLSTCEKSDYFSCLYGLAEKNNDRNICLIMENIAAGFCSKDEISKLALDSPRGLKDMCFYSTVGSAADCKAIQDVDMKGQCIFENATKLSDCSDIPAVGTPAKNSRDYKEMCIERVERSN